MAIDVTGADAYFATQLTDARWTAIAAQATEALAMAITDIATVLGYDDDTDLDEDDENQQRACYEQALYLGENLTQTEALHHVSVANLNSQIVEGLGEESYKNDGSVKIWNGIVLASRASLYVRRIRGTVRAIR